MERRSLIWRVAVNILNKRARTADKKWFSSLGVGRVSKNRLTIKTDLVKERINVPLPSTNTLVRS
jgi:hypothetical protein